MPKRLVLIDGYSLLFRAFYGTRFLSTSDGRPTNALFGFTNTLLAELARDDRPDALVVALDYHGKTFRHEKFEEYKGTRRETPDELISQLVYSRDLVRAFNLPVIELEGFEADDVIGTISRQAEENGYSTTIITGDKDSLQLVDDHVTVMMPGIRGADPTYYSPEAVRERFGFEPPQMIDYKALAGDSSDNIPGAPGIGDKTATLLVQRFGTIEAMLESLDGLEEKYRKKVEPAIEQIRLSKWLATIDRHAPIDYDFAPYRVDTEHASEALAMLESLEFKSQARRLQTVLKPFMSEGAVAVTAAVGAETIEPVILEPLESYVAIKSWVGGKAYALTTAEEPSQGNMFDEAVPAAVVVAVGGETRRVPTEAALKLIESQSRGLVAHDTKSWFHRCDNLSMAAPQFDARLAAYVLQSSRSSYELTDLAQGYLDTRAGTPEQQACALHLLEREMRGRLKAEGQEGVLNEIEIPLVPVLVEMEKAGIRVDKGFLTELSGSLEAALLEAQTAVYKAAGTEFNVGSPKQIGEVLFDQMGLPGGRKTKTGWATGAEVLSEIEHPVAPAILNFRELSKLKGTYADALPKMIADDGRIHTTFNQTVAATGRLSSIDPNLQNIPVRTELGRQIRRAFVAADGHALVSFDYSQIELRVLAHMSKDPNLVSAFQRHEDVHTVTASHMFHVPESDVTKEQRGLAKLLNYAVLYGVTDFGLANQLGAGFSRTDAAALITQYNERFPSVKEFTNGMVEEARARGFTTTLCGRRRQFPDIHAANRGVRQYAERQAMNAPIQGTAADMIKLAMLKVRTSLGSSETKMLLQVHDELVFEAPMLDSSLFSPIKSDMETALPLDVPVEVDGKAGPNWLEMKPLG